MTQDFDAAFAAFLQDIIASNNDPTVKFETDVGSRYIRVVRVEQNNPRTLHCFVDRTHGEVLIGSWKQPRRTKQPRGNIFDANNNFRASA